MCFQDFSVFTNNPAKMTSKVKHMISMFESFGYQNVNNEPAKLRKTNFTMSMDSIHAVNRTDATKSIKSASKRPSEHKTKTRRSTELLQQLEQQVQHLSNTLKGYRTYNRESQMFYQNQIFFLLVDIINVDAKGDPYIVSKKNELIEVLKRINIDLNSRLPENPEENYIELPAPVVKQMKEERRVEKKVQPVQKQEIVELEEPKQAEDFKVPSVKSLKQLWEKGIVETEKPKANTSVKTSATVVKLDPSETRYIPYNERFKKSSFEKNSENELHDRSSFKKDSVNSLDSLEMYEESVVKNSSGKIETNSVFKKTNSVDIPESPIYEVSNHSKNFHSQDSSDDDKPGKLQSYLLLSRHTDEGSDFDSDVQINGDEEDV